MRPYSIGLDYGTGSIRAILVDVSNGETVAESIYPYKYGVDGVIIDASDPNLARQHPQDYLDGSETVLRELLALAKTQGISPEKIIGIGIDTTGSTPIPVDIEGTPLALKPEFKDDPDAMVWLWKDHSAHQEAAEITEAAASSHPEYLAKIGGVYSSEWFWAKILKCARSNPRVSAAAVSWVEHTDWMPALFCGTQQPSKIRRSVCAAGHKGIYHPSWGGYPAKEFLNSLDPELGRIRDSLPDEAYPANQKAGNLSQEWARRLGLPEGIPLAIGAFDAHFGAIGAGITENVLVKNIGTSCCDIAVAPLSKELPDIPGLCGIVPGSVLPAMYGLEAGQSAIGDIFSWYAGLIAPGRKVADVLSELEAQAKDLAPGKSGLLALDWQNGNRTILVDQRLSGLVLGLSLHSTAAEIYRALVEATAFGAKVIIERLEAFGVKLDRVLACGGIPYKSPMLMQIYADIFERPIELSRSRQTAALGSSIAAAVVAGSEAGGYASFDEAMKAMTGTLELVYRPNPENSAVYRRLYALYKEVHDAFGLAKDGNKLGATAKDSDRDLFGLMKELLDIRDGV